MRAGRPRKVRFVKSSLRRRRGVRRSPKQIAAQRRRNQVRRTRGR